jgi:HK97 family phage major capsid protein
MEKKELAAALQVELQKARSEAATAHKVFSDARDAAADEHGVEGLAQLMVTNSEAFDKLDDLNRAQSEASQRAADLEARLVSILKWDDETIDPGSSSNGHAGGPSITNVFENAQPQYRKVSDRFVESSVYRDLVKSGLLERSKSRIQTNPVEVMSRDETVAWLEAGGPNATLITSESGSGGTFMRPQRLPGFYELLYGPNSVLALVTNGTTDGDTVEFVRQVDFTNNAAETPEANFTGLVAAAGGGDVTGVKPESGMTFEIVQEFVRTIAHWIPATRRILSDVGQLRTIIDSQMRAGVLRRLEAQIAGGNGQGENLLGIINTPDVNEPAVGLNFLETIHKGITAVRLAFMEPSAIGIHPHDWERARLLRDDSGAGAGTGGYMYGPPAIAGAQTLWGLPTVVSASFPVHTSIVADWSQAILWAREGVTITATDSHSDWFVRNLIAVLAEGRWAFGIPRPQAFSVCDISDS